MSQDGGGRYYPFYKGPSAISLFSLNEEEEEEEEGDGDCMFGVDIIDTSSDLFSSRRERRERSTLFSEELNEKRSTSPLFPDGSLSSNQKRSLSSLLSDESSSSNQNENNDDHDIRFLAPNPCHTGDNAAMIAFAAHVDSDVITENAETLTFNPSLRLT